MKYAFTLISCLIVTITAYSQSITHTWKASAVEMYGTYYSIAGSETPEAISNFYNNLKKQNNGEGFSEADSAMSVLSYMIMIEYATGISLSLSADGNITYTAHLLNRKELHTETGTYKLKGSTIRTNLKTSKTPDFIIVSLSENELVLNGVLGTDKFPVKFVRVD